ncbi:MAG: 6-hydroxymethylpterin diphosphokinase MptE-like protein [Candidatus Sumerlaeia bacterium]
MTTLLYLPEGSTLLAERWLAAQPAEARVFLLHEYGMADAARTLTEKYRFIQDHALMPGSAGAENEALRARLASIERAVLPVAPGSYPLIFQEPAAIPDIRPYYPLVRRLWTLGVRHFEICNLGGSFAFSVPHLLDEFVNRHRGRRCFVVGNGPSLNQIDMSRLKDEITLGANRGYLGFERWGFQFTYWGMIDWLQIEQYGPEYEAAIPAETVKFVPYKYLPLLRFENACPMNTVYTPRPVFSERPDQLYRGHSVTYALIEAAAMMGCDPIILVGIDHRYNLAEPWPQKTRRAIRQTLVRPIYDMPFYQGIRAWREARSHAKKQGQARPALWSAADAGEPTHFDDKYTGGQHKQFMMPYPRESERDYRCALAWARRHGRRILNATPGSALQVFPKVAFDTLFR